MIDEISKRNRKNQCMGECPGKTDFMPVLRKDAAEEYTDKFGDLLPKMFIPEFHIS